MSNKVLFVYEGANTEKKVADSFNKCFPNENITVECAYCTTIYNLYNKISQDEDLDTFSILKEMPINKESLESFTRNDFAEVYLFFDYDGHTSSANDETLVDILNFFNEETEFGKIFINYPMVESLKHYSNAIDFKLLKVEAKKDIKYKNKVHIECDEKYKHYHLYSKSIWLELIELHLKKMSYIVNGNYVFPTEYCLQDEVFSNQLEKYIKVDSTIAVLSSFPIFIFEYYGKDYISNMISE